MIGIKTGLFLAGFFLCFVAGIVHPMWALVGYMGVYLVAPENVWWGRQISHWGIRYSFLIGACLAVSMALHWNKLEYGRRFLVGLEKILLMFLGWAVFTHFFLGPPPTPVVVMGTDKIVKVIVFLLMMMHLVTRMDRFRVVSWVIILGGLLFGLRAYTAPPWAFSQGRLNALGGPDFVSSNPFALQMSVSLVFAGIEFIRSRWSVRIFLMLTAAFILNAIIMARGRGAFLGLSVGGLVAALLAPPKYKRKVWLALLAGIVGFFVLSEPKYWQRVLGLSEEEVQEDESAQGRLETWEAAMAMFRDHPLGVGRGKFHMVIGRYNPKYANRDAHNTFIRCLCELGLPGILMYGGILFLAVRYLLRVRAQAADSPEGANMGLYAYGVLIALTIYLCGGIFSTVLYVEGVWWLIGMSVCLLRIAEKQREGEDLPVRPGAARSRRRVVTRS